MPLRVAAQMRSFAGTSLSFRMSGLYRRSRRSVPAGHSTAQTLKSGPCFRWVIAGGLRSVRCIAHPVGIPSPVRLRWTPRMQDAAALESFAEIAASLHRVNRWWFGHRFGFKHFAHRRSGRIYEVVDLLVKFRACFEVPLIRSLSSF